MDLTRLPQLVRSTGRFRDVTAILAKYGLATWMQAIHIDWVQRLFKSEDGRKISDLEMGVRVRMALTELGPTFIKLGQILSTRPDLVGPDISDELAKLQTATPPDPPGVARATLERELGRPPEEIFAEFEEKAFASASIAQIHRAKRHDGREVVVKIQHAGIEDQIRSDLEILTQLAHLAEEIAPQLRAYQPRSTAAEFGRTLTRELDFGLEARNLTLFARNFRAHESVRIPTPYPEMSSRRVLTMDYLDGISVANTQALVEAGYDLSAIARRGARLFVDMIFRDGFYHADPHPGNLLVLPGEIIGLLDCGMVGRLDDELREMIEDMVIAIVDHDSERLTDLVVRIGQPPEDFDRSALRRDLDELSDQFRDIPIAELDLREAIEGIFRIVRDHRILLPSRIALILKILVMLEGTSRHLSSTFSVAEILEPYREQAIRRRLSPARLMRKAGTAYREWSRLFEILPGDAADILQRVKRGKFDVHLDHRRLDSIVNRLVLGVLTAALFMGSANLWSRNVPPMLGPYSVPGAVGCFVAVFLGWRLLRAIMRTEGLRG